MLALLPADLASEIEQLVSTLSGDRDEVPPDISRTLDEYGRTLLPLPAGWQAFASRYDVQDADRIDIDVTMWTLEEGRSDLTLQIQVWPKADGWRLEVYDLRVM